jgi:hypothetical protein
MKSFRFHLVAAPLALAAGFIAPALGQDAGRTSERSISQ